MFPTTGSRMTPAIVSPSLLEGFGQRRGVVVTEDNRIGRGAAGDARRIRYAQGRGRAASGHEQAIHVPVIVARELHDLVPRRKASSQPNRAHRRFGARIHQPHLFDRTAPPE